jgi:60 kDa SS-A/Ro ribonucleoprotein
MRLNLKSNHAFGGVTFEGAPAAYMTDEQALRRSVLSCLLWEKEFYESGEDIAIRILDLTGKVAPEKVAALAVEARSVFHLRHAPLMLISALSRHSGGKIVENAVAETIQRADELTELLAIHAHVNGVSPSAVKKKIPAAMKRGLARAFGKFDEYALAKYNRDGAIKLRDVLFLCHAKAKDVDQALLWKRLIDGQLTTPDTWEVALSAGADKREAFERMLREGTLGYLALLRNLRNMVSAGCDLKLVRDAIVARKGAHRVLPFRYVAAARACPQLEPEIDTALCESIATSTPLSGRTVVLVDVSGSMRDKLSARSDMTRMDAACALASVINGDLRVFSFADDVIEIPPRRGMAGVDAIQRSQSGGTRLFDAVAMINEKVEYDRIIVITDEQATDPSRYGYWIQGRVKTLPGPKKRGYMVNVASAKNGVGYGPWVHIDGFSENVIRFISETENDRARA